MLAFITRYWPWLLAGAATIAAVVFVSAVYLKGETAGGAKVQTEVLTQTIQTQRKIDDAEARGPRTPRDVSRRLRDGTF